MIRFPEKKAVFVFVFLMMKRKINKEHLHKASDSAIVRGCHKRQYKQTLIDSIDMKLGMIESLATIATITELDAAVALFDKDYTNASEKTKRRFRRKANLRAKILSADK